MKTNNDGEQAANGEAEASLDLILPTEGHLGRACDPAEGRDPDGPSNLAEVGGLDVSDHLGPAGDPVEGG